MGMGNGFMGEYRNLNEQKGVCVVTASVGIIHNVPEGVSRLCGLTYTCYMYITIPRPVDRIMGEIQPTFRKAGVIIGVLNLCPNSQRLGKCLLLFVLSQ